MKSLIIDEVSIVSSDLSTDIASKLGEIFIMIDETTDFEEPVTEANIASSLIEDCLTVMAVKKFQKKVVCCKCNQKFDMVNSKKILKCRNRGTVRKLKLCKFSFCIELMFQK